MKKVITLLAVSLMFVTGASAQNNLGDILGGLLGGNTSTGNTTVDNALGSVLGDLLGKVVTPTLDGTYNYNGIAVSMTKDEGGIASSLAGTAVSSAVETKIDELLAKYGIKPGAMTVTFNDADKTFTWTIGGFPFNGTYQLGLDNKAITLNFGRTLKFFSMTGSMDLTLDGVKMLFSSENTTAFIKKALAKLGEKKTDVGTIAQMAAGYDNYRVGFKLSK